LRRQYYFKTLACLRWLRFCVAACLISAFRTFVNARRKKLTFILRQSAREKWEIVEIKRNK